MYLHWTYTLMILVGVGEKLWYIHRKGRGNKLVFGLKLNKIEGGGEINKLIKLARLEKGLTFNTKWD